VARRIFDAVRALGIAHELSPTATHVTVSAGAACTELGVSLEMPASEFVTAADRALYAAKAAGRARVCVRDLPESGPLDSSLDDPSESDDGLTVRSK
jgi:PleD family two-component response regulator